MTWRTHRTERRHSPYVKNDYYTSKEFRNIHNALDVNTSLDVIKIRPLLRALFPTFTLRDTPDTSSDLSQDIWHMYHDTVPDARTIPDEALTLQIAKAIASQRLEFINGHWRTYYPSHKIVDLSAPLPQMDTDPAYAPEPADPHFHPPQGYDTAKTIIASIRDTDQDSNGTGSFFLMSNGKFLSAGSAEGHEGAWRAWLELDNTFPSPDNVKAFATREHIVELTSYARPGDIPEFGFTTYTALTPAQEATIYYIRRYANVVVVDQYGREVG